MAYPDKRSRKLAVVAHCILNQNSRVPGLAQFSAVITEIVNVLQENNIGILQLPCPELICCGFDRPRKTKEEYNIENYRQVCKKIAESTTVQLDEFTKGHVSILTVIGIKNSPTCGAGNSPNETGILIEELKLTIKKRGKAILFLNLNTKNVSDCIKRLKKIVKQDTPN